MIVKLNNDTFRVQFIKEVEPRRGGRTTIKTICKIFKCIEESCIDNGPIQYKWELFSTGVARQNPVDKYNHMIGKRVALQHAMIKNLNEVQRIELCNKIFVTIGEIYEVPKDLYHFDRVERSVFAQRLEKEFDQNA